MDRERNLEGISKFVSYLLRHRPDSVGVRLSRDGWVDIDVLLAGIAAHGANAEPLSRDTLLGIVRGSDKQRFAISGDGRRIRASQGHSQRSGVRLTESLAKSVPPVKPYHGTKATALPQIRKKGLLKMTREHVHLSATMETAQAVGDRRNGRTVILKIDAKAMGPYICRTMACG